MNTRARLAALVDDIDGQTLKKPKPQSTSGPDTPVDNRIRFLSALIFANLGGTATIQQAGKNEIAVATTDGPIFTLKFDKERVTLGGSPTSPNLDQFVGSIDEDDELASLNTIAENSVTLIQEAMDADAPSPPVFFKGLAEAPAPEAEDGDMGADTLQPAPGAAEEPPLDAPPPDGGLPAETPPGGPQVPGAPPPGGPPGMGAPPMGGPPMGQPGMPPPMGGPPMGQPGMGMPSASRIRASLEALADDIQASGQTRLASRVDILLNTFERQTGLPSPQLVAGTKRQVSPKDPRNKR